MFVKYFMMKQLFKIWRQIASLFYLKFDLLFLQIFKNTKCLDFGLILPRGSVLGLGLFILYIATWKNIYIFSRRFFKSISMTKIVKIKINLLYRVRL
jgi:hypothetical protein